MSARQPGDERMFVGRRLRIDRRAALELLRRIGADRHGMRELRRLYAEEVRRSSLHTLADEVVLAQLAERIAAGTLSMALVRRPEAPAPPYEDEATEEAAETAAEQLAAMTEAAATPAQVEKATASIAFTVLLPSGEPAGAVKLEVVTPSGEVKKVRTGRDGTLRVDSIDPGACDVRSPWKSEARIDTLGFVALAAGTPAKEEAAGAEAEGSSLKPKEPGQAAGKKKESTRSGTATIAVVEQHKVRAGETLAALAESVGLSWKELARFNFGTDNPEEINQALRRVVGCRKKTADGKNYVFDDADDPGILLLPTPWEAKGLSTGASHTIVVEQAALPEKKPEWTFSM